MKCKSVKLFLAKAAFMLPAVACAQDDQAIQGKLQRVQNDFLNLHTALESYHMDNDSFAKSTTVTSEMASFSGAPAGTPSFAKYSGNSSDKPSHPAATLTTPINYLPGAKLPPDPFASNSVNTYAYFGDAYGFLTWSPGPDGKYDTDWTAFDTRQKPTKSFTAKYSYDPTNGTISPGDILHGDGWSFR